MIAMPWARVRRHETIVRGAFNYPGGKWYIKASVYPLATAHRVYTEACAGAANVLLNKERSEVEVIADADADVINCHRVVRDHPEQLAEVLAAVPFGEEEFLKAKARLAMPQAGTGQTLIYRAADFMVVRRMSRSGTGCSFTSAGRERDKAPRWNSAIRRIKKVSERYQGVIIEQADAIETLMKWDAPDALHYLDPPYVHSTRVSKKLYGVEQADAWHRRLLHAARGCRGQVILSGYRSPLYDELLPGWRRVEVDMPNHASCKRTKQRKVEVLYVKEG